MKKKNLVPLLGIAFIVAVVSTGVFYGLFVGRLNSAVPAGPGSAQILVAARDLQPGEFVSEADVKRIPWVAPGVPAGSISEPAELLGKVVLQPVSANDLIHRTQVGTESGGDLDSGTLGIPGGMRAVSLQIQDSAGVVAMLRPGLLVDIQVVGNMPSSRGVEPHLRTLLESVKVLTLPKDNGTVRAGTHIVTVLVNPHDASILGLADSSAKVRISLRNPLDKRTEARETVGYGSLFLENSAIARKQ